MIQLNYVCSRSSGERVFMGQARLKGKNKDERLATVLAQHSSKLLTPERYNAFVAWTRSPIAPVFAKDIAYYATENETVLGVVVMDRVDRDFGFVSLGRDQKGRFRCIDFEVGMSRIEAQHALLRNLKAQFESGESVFPQGDEDGDKAGFDLFTPVVEEEKLGQTFKLLSSSDHWLPARSIMSEMTRHVPDVDGNFVEQFQTTALESRMWELYLYAALLEEGLFVSRPNPAPDFMVSWGETTVYIEAVTVNPSPNDLPPEPNRGPIHRSQEEMARLLADKIPIKFGSPLWSKLSRKKPYWEIPEVSGNPLVFPPSQNSCRLNTLPPSGAKEQITWLDTDKRTRIGWWRDCCRQKVQQ